MPSTLYRVRHARSNRPARLEPPLQDVLVELLGLGTRDHVEVPLESDPATAVLLERCGTPSLRGIELHQSAVRVFVSRIVPEELLRGRDGGIGLAGLALPDQQPLERLQRQIV